MVRFSRSPDIEFSPLRDHLMLVNTESRRFFVLNAANSVMWSRLAEPCDEQELAEELCQRFADVTPETALSDVRRAVKELSSLELIRSDQETSQTQGDGR